MRNRLSTSACSAGVFGSLGLAVAASVLLPLPAWAAEGSELIGHRCRTYDADVSNENTLAALTEVARTPGVTCEIDVWRLADGTNIVWHDPTWERVADVDTLPSGVSPTDRVSEATWAEVSQVRTKGGEPVARLSQMIEASAELGVPLLVEVMNTVSDPQRVVELATEAGADVRYYGAPSDTCSTPELDRLSEAGAEVGIKLLENRPCQLRPAQLAAAGASFATVVGTAITPNYSRRMHTWGVEVYARWASVDAVEALLADGADKVMVENPVDVVDAAR
jgi:glycerophosphoryl diester phosphodiesterase